MNRRILGIAAGALALATVAFVSIGARPDAGRASHDARVARGEYLVKIMGCNDCHTPLTMGERGPEPDMARMLSGHPENCPVGAAPAVPGTWLMTTAVTGTAFAGPWGISYTANLTPDQNTGLGIWTEEMFVNAIRTGKHMGVSRPINPPMPWQTYRFATDEDLKSLYAYLRTIPPVVNHVPDYQPPAVTTH
jgi:hypothetical protein